MESLLAAAFAAITEGLKLANQKALPPFIARRDKLLSERREERAKGQLSDDLRIHAIDQELKDLAASAQQEITLALAKR